MPITIITAIASIILFQRNTYNILFVLVVQHALAHTKLLDQKMQRRRRTSRRFASPTKRVKAQDTEWTKQHRGDWSDEAGQERRYSEDSDDVKVGDDDEDVENSRTRRATGGAWADRALHRIRRTAWRASRSRDQAPTKEAGPTTSDANMDIAATRRRHGRGGRQDREQKKKSQARLSGRRRLRSDVVTSDASDVAGESGISRDEDVETASGTEAASGTETASGTGAVSHTKRASGTKRASRGGRPVHDSEDHAVQSNEPASPPLSRQRQRRKLSDNQRRSNNQGKPVLSVLTGTETAVELFELRYGANHVPFFVTLGGAKYRCKASGHAAFVAVELSLSPRTPAKWKAFYKNVLCNAAFGKTCEARGYVLWLTRREWDSTSEGTPEEGGTSPNHHHHCDGASATVRRSRIGKSNDMRHRPPSPVALYFVGNGQCEHECEYVPLAKLQSVQRFEQWIERSIVAAAGSRHESLRMRDGAAERMSTEYGKRSRRGWQNEDSGEQEGTRRKRGDLEDSQSSAVSSGSSSRSSDYSRERNRGGKDRSSGGTKRSSGDRERNRGGTRRSGGGSSRQRVPSFTEESSSSSAAGSHATTRGQETTSVYREWTREINKKSVVTRGMAEKPPSTNMHIARESMYEAACMMRMRLVDGQVCERCWDAERTTVHDLYVWAWLLCIDEGYVSLEPSSSRLQQQQHNELIVAFADRFRLCVGFPKTVLSLRRHSQQSIQRLRLGRRVVVQLERV